MKFTFSLYQKFHIIIIFVFGFVFLVSNIIVVNVVKLNMEGAIGSFIVLSFLVLLFTLIITIYIVGNITRKLNQPLEGLQDTMKESLLNGRLIKYDGEMNDYSEALIQGYNDMASQINEQNAKFKVVTNELLESDRKLREEYLRIAQLAYSDYITGLPNRVKFEEVAKQKIEDRERFAFMFLDLDNFKEINDEFGHTQGDKVINYVSKRIEKCCSERNFIARLSSNTFGVILPIKVNKNEVKEKAKSLLIELSKPIDVGTSKCVVKGSVGISVFPDDGESIKVIMQNADIAMSEAKVQGENQVFTYTAELELKDLDKSEDKK